MKKRYSMSTPNKTLFHRDFLNQNEKRMIDCRDKQHMLQQVQKQKESLMTTIRDERMAILNN